MTIITVNSEPLDCYIKENHHPDDLVSLTELYHGYVDWLQHNNLIGKPWERYRLIPRRKRIAELLEEMGHRLYIPQGKRRMYIEFKGWL